MPVINMYRDAEVAVVDSDHEPTYANFLANGWTLEKAEPEAAPAPEPEPVADEAPAPEPEAPAPKARKAR